MQIRIVPGKKGLIVIQIPGYNPQDSSITPPYRYLHCRNVFIQSFSQTLNQKRCKHKCQQASALLKDP